MRKVVNVLAVTLTCAVIGVTADVFRKIGISLYTEQYLAGLLALAHAAALPLRAGERRAAAGGAGRCRGTTSWRRSYPSPA